MKPYYLTLSERKLRELLNRQGLAPDGVDRIVSHVQEQRRAVKAARAYRVQHVKEWRSLLTPLRQEWNNAKVGAAYAPDDALRVAAFEAYASVLYALHERLTLAAYNTASPITPSLFAVEINERNTKAGKNFRVRNNGVHWADWVRPKERESVEQAFAQWAESGTRKKQAKIKEPFKRVEGDKVFAKKKERLLNAVTNERDALQLKYEVALQGLAIREQTLADVKAKRLEDKNDVHLRLEKRLRKARRAHSILSRWEKADGALPRTWHGVLTLEER
jgi:hypothetical protein